MQTLYSAEFRGSPIAIFPDGPVWTAFTSWGWAYRGSREGGPVTETRVTEMDNIKTYARFGDLYAVASLTRGLRIFRESDLSVVRDLPEIAGGQVANGGSFLAAEGKRGVLFGLDPAGNTLWELPMRGLAYGVAVSPAGIHVTFSHDGLKSWPFGPNGVPKKKAIAWTGGGIPLSVAVGRDALWVGHDRIGKVSKISLDGTTLLGEVQLDRAWHLSIRALNGVEYLVGSGTARVWVVNTATLEEVKSFPVPNDRYNAEAPTLDAAGDLWFGCDTAVVRTPAGL